MKGCSHVMAVDRVQMGAAYLTHRARGDGIGMADVASSMGSGLEAALCFIEVATALARKVADLTGLEPAEVTGLIAEQAAFVSSCRSD